MLVVQGATFAVAPARPLALRTRRTCASIPSPGRDAMNPSLNPRWQPPATMSRRRFLQAGGIGALTLGVPGLVTATVDANQPLGRGAAERSCIFLLLCGGPSHLDTWDLKPQAPEGIRGPYRPI